MHLRALRSLFTAVVWLLLWGSDGIAADVPRTSFGRAPAVPKSLDLLTPPERAPAPLASFAELQRFARELPLTPRRATSLRFQSQLAPIAPPRPLLSRDDFGRADQPWRPPPETARQWQP
jgi:hypothetical protein